MTDENANQASPEPEETTAENAQEQAGEMPPMPPADFSYLCQTFYIQALINIGVIPNPTTQSTEAHPELAKFNIAMLEILEQKTKGNLTEQEAKLIEDCLHQTRMAFLEIGKNEEA